MKRLIIITIILLAATVGVTIIYFKNLSPPGVRTGQVMRTIPDDASFIFELNNEKGFYDIFEGNSLLSAIVGKSQTQQLDTLRKLLISSPQLDQFFTGQNILISLHPAGSDSVGMLITTTATKTFETAMFDKPNGDTKNTLQISATKIGNSQGYDVLIKPINKHFYIVKKGDNIFSGSFSKELATRSALYKNNKDVFVPLSEQQISNSLASLYVNYRQLPSLFDQIFSNQNDDIFKSFRLLPAVASLSLNYKSDALMFNGFTSLQNNATSYLNIFTEQKPVENHLKDIFPATTAYSMNFAVSDPHKFADDLSGWHVKAGLADEKDQLFSKIKSETGLLLKPEFEHLLGNEFAVVTTRYMEKYIIVSVKDGSKLLPLMTNISTMETDNIGRFNYDKLPFFLLGDAFSILKRPFFMIIDNYLVLANSASELRSYNDTYFNRKFISKIDEYNQFDDLIAERSNATFYINFKNTRSILKQDLKSSFFNAFENANPGWRNFYSAAWQLTASDKNFYTNFCIKLNSNDTTAVKSN